MSAIVQARPPAGGGGSAYTHVQSTPAATWTVVHNLGLRPVPMAMMIDSDPSSPIYPDAVFPDVNTIVITLPSADTGRVVVA